MGGLSLRRWQRRARVAALVARDQELSGTGSWRWDVRRGRLAWSPNLYRIHGVDPATFELTVDAAMALVHEDDRRSISAAVGHALATGEPLSMSYRIVRPDGSLRDLEWRGIVERDGRGLARRLDGAIRDVSDQRRAERWLAASESRYRLIVENANDGIWVLDGEGRTDFVNARICQMLGRAPEELLGRTPAEFADAGGAAALAAGADSGEPSGYLELAFLHADGTPLWVALSTSRYDAPWGPVEVHILTDLSQRREMEERLRHAAQRDPLTNAWSRPHFEDLLVEELAGPGGERGSTAVIFLDLDHFKYVNDSLGHHVGDRLLRRVAEVFSATLRDGDQLARLSGDEFAVLLRGADQPMAMHVAERLLAALRRERWRGMSSLSASAGVAVAAPDDGALTAGDLLVAADIALHQAKQDGRNRQAVYTGDRGGFTWLGEIRAAIEEERLVLYSQAIVPLTGGHHSEELLVRMVGRDGELIQPVAFVPPAEQFGLIVEIDRWVVSQALELARQGRAVEVNLSGQSLGDEPIREAVEAAVASGVRPELLTFEITETAAARNLDVARAFSNALSKLGCGFAIDDFGTGFGSLIYLRHLPITRVKIDTQFVREMLTIPDDERVVRAIVSTARAMGQVTVAEGVEDEATLQRLAEIGVDYAQGFHIQRPAPVEAAPGPVGGRHEAAPRDR
jgi:diguanylate cyclase (GGDEF)-like protein/PAS domain S-box-containing protein